MHNFREIFNQRACDSSANPHSRLCFPRKLTKLPRVKLKFCSADQFLSRSPSEERYASLALWAKTVIDLKTVLRDR